MTTERPCEVCGEPVEEGEGIRSSLWTPEGWDTDYIHFRCVESLDSEDDPDAI